MLVAAQLPAQSTPPAPSAADPAEKKPDATKEEPLKLSPFQVNKSKDRGYAAGNTLSGGRVDTPLELTPARFRSSPRISWTTSMSPTSTRRGRGRSALTWAPRWDSSNPSSISTYTGDDPGRANPTKTIATRQTGLINFGVARQL